MRNELVDSIVPKGNLGVVGLGYVGLPLAVQAAEKGLKVKGIDLNTKLVEMVNGRVSPYVNDKRFDSALSSIGEGSLIASTSAAELNVCETIIVCVPTPTIDNKPDLSFVLKSARDIGSILRRGQLIILESTVNAGATRDDFLPILEDMSGLKVGFDFYLAHCPERIDPGNEKFFVGNLNRVVGGITEECTKKAVDFYKSIIDAEIISLGSTEEAEFVKSWENSHRNVMIALANNAAIISDALDMDIGRIMMGLQSKVDQFGLSLAKPGIGPGGHCIPEDIHYVIKKARQKDVDTGFLQAAAELNDKMPRYAVQRLISKLCEYNMDISDMSVALLGLAYKPNVGDTRRSPSIEVGYELQRHTGSLILHDPYVNELKIAIKGVKITNNLDEALSSADIIFVGTAHSEYLKLITPETLKKYNVKCVFDGRNCLDKSAFDGSGIYYFGIGK